MVYLFNDYKTLGGYFMMNVQRLINGAHNVYIFICPDLPVGYKRVLIEANSITNAINLFFNSYANLTYEDLSNIRGIYFDKNGNQKEIDLKGAYRRRVNA